VDWLLCLQKTDHNQVKKEVLTSLTLVLAQHVDYEYETKSGIKAPMIVEDIKDPDDSYPPNHYMIFPFITHHTLLSRRKPQQFIIIKNYILEAPSLFTVNVIFSLYKPKFKSPKDLPITEDFKNYGKQLGVKLWKSRKEIRSKKTYLELPESLAQYYEAFPEFLTDFLLEIVNYLYHEKLKIINTKRKQRGKSPKSETPNLSKKIVTLLALIFLTITYPAANIWLPNILASMCGRPQLLSSLNRLLLVFHIISHTERHEKRMENKRMQTADPTSCLNRKNNTWNVTVIDNIDFKQKRFQYGNIYDVTRESAHATLRMTF
jgi:hypothetical protein